jgi:ssDNA-binding Zn-finger/Zn-ribbon topoisomerase 1
MSEKYENTSPLVKLGDCPKCGKGQIVVGSIGYACNYFKSIDDKCTFIIYPTYFGKEITEELATLLIEGGETEVFSDLKKKDESIFIASLKYEGGFIKPNFKEWEKKTLEIECPFCGSEIEDGTKGFSCAKFWKKDEDENRLCSLYISKEVAGRSIGGEEAEILLNGEKTPFLSGLKNKAGKEFTARLFMNKSGAIEFDSVLCECPKCGGKMYISEKAYNCGNWKENKCNFSIWREIGRREITPEEAIELCQNKITPTLTGFKGKEGGSYDRKLTINEEFKVVMI